MAAAWGDEVNDRLTASQYRRMARQNAPQAERWKEYEQRKQGWLRTHPEATHAEYEKEMRAIAKRLGV